jgi:hypothetical protein
MFATAPSDDEYLHLFLADWRSHGRAVGSRFTGERIRDRAISNKVVIPTKIHYDIGGAPGGWQPPLHFVDTGGSACYSPIARLS